MGSSPDTKRCSTVRLRSTGRAKRHPTTCGTALRSIGVQGDKFVLNGRPLTLRLVLDQGYWPDTGQTPPDDAALRRDVELAKAMGFNGVRKHQKLEDPRYLYWADQLGLLVWTEMPSAYRFTQASVERVSRQWTDAMTRDYSHPCVVAWVPFNESWGVPDLPVSVEQRHALLSKAPAILRSRRNNSPQMWRSACLSICSVRRR